MREVSKLGEVVEGAIHMILNNKLLKAFNHYYHYLAPDQREWMALLADFRSSKLARALSYTAR